MRGPTSNEMASAVSAARIARSVRYWKTWKPEWYSASQAVTWRSI